MDVNSIFKKITKQGIFFKRIRLLPETARYLSR